MDYLAPEELAIGEVSNRLEDRELINFWKIGVLIYEIAYCCLPFPVEYVAECAAYKCKFFLRFPDRSARSRELELFLMLLLKLDPLQRGGGANWKREVAPFI